MTERAQSVADCAASEVVEQLPASCPLVQLAEQACAVKAGRFGAGLAPENRARLVAEWLRWSQDEKSLRSWEYLASLPDGKRIDRDRFLDELFASIGPGGANRALASGVQALMQPWESFRRHFFGWFLRRFEYQAACRVYPHRRLASWLGWSLAALAVVADSLCMRSFGLDPEAAIAVFLGLAAALVLARPLTGLPADAYASWMTPRLAAAVGFGYLFLTSASSVVRVLLFSRWLARHAVFALVLLLAAAWLYVLLHIFRRVRPRLRAGALFRRSGDVVALATCYTAAELLLAAPLLFSPVFLGATPEELKAHPLQAHHLALCAAIALNLGVVLQLAWDEKPLTEPL